MEMEIKCLSENYDKFERDVVNIFVDVFHSDFLNFCEDKDLIKKLFLNTFNPNAIFIAYLENKAVGIVAYSDNKQRAISLAKEKCIFLLGEKTGEFAYYMMQKEFLNPLPYNDNTSYIDIVITLPEARGKSVAKNLINHVFANTNYSEYILEVGDTNDIAVNLYKNIGFNEFERKKEEFPKETGYNERIFMKICK